MDVDSQNNKLRDRIQAKFLKIKNAVFAEGFVTASILFCAGAMGVVASLNVGLNGNCDTLMVRGFIDCLITSIFATAFGIGVMFSSITVFIYQAVFIILTSILSKYLDPELVALSMAWDVLSLSV